MRLAIPGWSATVAQPAEQPLRKRRVKGSIPFGGSNLNLPSQIEKGATDLTPNYSLTNSFGSTGNRSAQAR